MIKLITTIKGDEKIKNYLLTRHYIAPRYYVSLVNQDLDKILGKQYLLISYDQDEQINGFILISDLDFTVENSLSPTINLIYALEKKIKKDLIKEAIKYLRKDKVKKLYAYRENMDLLEEGFAYLNDVIDTWSRPLKILVKEIK